MAEEDGLRPNVQMGDRLRMHVVQGATNLERDLGRHFQRQPPFLLLGPPGQ